jgi:hypothetical protein
MDKHNFTFTFSFTVSRDMAEDILDCCILLFAVLGMELGVDYVGGFVLDEVKE